jgi:voltage-gated potassium channel
MSQTAPTRHGPGLGITRDPATAEPNSARAAMRRFREEPASIRWALVFLIVGIVAVVAAASVIVWILDARDYPDLGSALWFTLQTVTTVGYGDDVPGSAGGRIVGGIVMVVGIAFITVLTALITSALVDAAQERRHRFQLAHQETVIRRMTVQVDELNDRIGRIESGVTSLVRRHLEDDGPS